MTMYFFDFDDGDGELIQDDDGQECKTVEEAKREAAETLAALAKDRVRTLVQ